jgi:dTDP-4-dehydrorhamnose reductase
VDYAENAEHEALQINAYGPSFLARACAISSARFVHISSDYVFSGNSSSPWLEESKLDPISAYGRTKAKGEELVQGIHSLESYIVRTAWLYSPWGQNFVKTMARKALMEVGTVEVVSDQLGQPTSAMDLAKQIHRMVEKEVRPGIYHGTNNGQASWFDFAREIFFLLNADVDRVIPIDSSQLRRSAKRPSYSVLGQNRWSMVGMQPMPDWREALNASLPSIISTLNMKE